MGKRHYYLDGYGSIDSGLVNGSLHTSTFTNKKDMGRQCIVCHKPIKKGEKYVIMLIMGGSDNILHARHYLADHPKKCILVTSVKKSFSGGKEYHCTLFVDSKPIQREQVVQYMESIITL